MTILVLGTPGSGKSALAENKTCELSVGSLYYLATMQVVDEASEKRVEKHLKARSGKGFITLERDLDICRALDDIENPEEATVLLECITNLAGNEMHRKGAGSIEEVCLKVTEDVTTLSKGVKNLIIVSNKLDDNDSFDEETRDYIRLVNAVNQRLREISEDVYELS